MKIIFKMHSVSTLLGLAFLTQLPMLSHQRSVLSLYDSDDAVVNFESGLQLENAIKGSSTAWTVEFYAHWCGHCQHFARIYKEFAEDLLPWSQFMRVAAINCGDSRNSDVCNKYEVTMYPTLRYIPPYADLDDIGVLREDPNQMPFFLKRDTIDIIETFSDNITYLHKGWPDLEAYNVLENEAIGDIISRTNSSAEKPVFILEDMSSYIGKETILNLFSLLPSNDTLRRIAVDNVTEIPGLPSTILSEMPAVITVDPATSDVRVLLTKGDVESMGHAILLYLFGNDARASLDPLEFEIDDEFARDIKAGPEDITRRRYTVFLTDLEKTIIYAFTNEISKYTPAVVVNLSPERRTQVFNAVVQFVRVLYTYLPEVSQLMPHMGIMNRFAKLTAAYIMAGNAPTPSQLVDLVSGLVDTISEQDRLRLYVDDTVVPWKGCRGTAPAFGGYPCGLWTLFHYLTVQQYLTEHGRPTDVLEAMYSYVDNFFGCRECADHFRNMTRQGDDFREAVASYDEAVMYLWSRHNEVNQRLSGSVSDDPVYPKKQFPSRRYCPSCHRSATGTDWSRQDVLTFLVDLYKKPMIDESTTNKGISDLLEPIVTTCSLALIFALGYLPSISLLEGLLFL